MQTSSNDSSHCIVFPCQIDGTIENEEPVPLGYSFTSRDTDVSIYFIHHASHSMNHNNWYKVYVHRYISQLV
jgi:hypothetical protein